MLPALPPTGKSFRFVRACVRASRAVCAARGGFRDVICWVGVVARFGLPFSLFVLSTLPFSPSRFSLSNVRSNVRSTIRSNVLSNDCSNALPNTLLNALPNTLSNTL